MPYYKDAQNGIHFLEDARFANLLPAGAVEITDEEMAVLTAPTAAQRNSQRAAEIAHRLAAIDAESIRALRAKAAGRGRAQDDTKLATLEDEADALRIELASL